MYLKPLGNVNYFSSSPCMMVSANNGFIYKRGSSAQLYTGYFAIPGIEYSSDLHEIITRSNEVQNVSGKCTEFSFCILVYSLKII